MFTPWSASDSTGLFQEFFAALSAALPRKTRAARKAKSAISQALQLAAPTAAAIPVIGTSIEQSSRLLGSQLESREDWSTAFERASKALREVGEPVLIIVDDVDRLQPTELLTLLRIIRLLGRFPSIDYLIAYDHRSTASLIQSSGPTSPTDDAFSLRFLEKIVQYPFHVPPLRQEQILSKLNTDLRDVVEVDPSTSAAHAWEDAEALFVRSLSTPRSLARYVEQQRFAASLLPHDEINRRDLELLTLLRSRHPSVYERLPRVREQLLSGNTGPLQMTDGKIGRATYSMDELVAGVPKDEQADVRESLTLLFPKLKLDSTISGQHSGGTKRVADADYFDRYFAFGLPGDDVRDSHVAAAVSEARHGSSKALASVVGGLDERTVNRVVNKIRALVAPGPVQSPGSSLLEALAEAAEACRKDHGNDSSPTRRLAHLCAEVLSQAPSDTAPHHLSEALRTLDPSGFSSSVAFWSRNEMGPSSDHAPAWWAEFASQLSVRATTTVLEHLRARDAAPLDMQFRVALSFATEYGDQDELARQIQSEVASGKFTVEDVAARFVPMTSLLAPGARWELSVRDIETQQFTALVGIADKEWFEEAAIEDFDHTDTSWANRRLAARGRFVPRRTQ